MVSRARKRLWILPAIQGALLGRVIVYWAFCLLAIATLGTCLVAVQSHPHSSGEMLAMAAAQLGLPLAASCLVLPIVVMDCLRLSHRFTGPLYRLRDGLQRMAAGETMQPIQLREGDMLRDVADEFNRVVERINRQSSANDQAAS